MFTSIRTKLAVSYALIIILCLLLAGLGSVLLINRYQRAAVLTRYRVTSAAITQQVQALLALRTRLPQIESRFADEVTRLGIRALLIGPGGQVLADTKEEDNLTGQRLPVRLQDLALAARGTPVVHRYTDPQGQRHVLVITALRPPAEGSQVSGPLPSYVAVSVPEKELQPAWRELVPPLATAGFLALLISTMIALVLSRSITRPLIAMTKASEQIARGQYEQVIPTRSKDEVARLADSFNRMTREVERSRQAQRDFLANVSHDLKTPLTSVQGFSQAMLEGAIHDEQGYRRAAQIIQTEAEKMGQLIETLLDLARFDAGEVMQQREPIAPGELVRQCVERLLPRAAEEGLELDVSVPQNLPVVHGDEKHLEQALSNLVDNAIRYTPPGGRVDVAVQALDIKRGKLQEPGVTPCSMPPATSLDGHWVAITVKDTGIGISEIDLPRVFERFYRADKSRTGAEGSGLGLAIAKDIVEAHGGIIHASSQPDHGSCFSILLPVQQTSAE